METHGLVLILKNKVILEKQFHSPLEYNFSQVAPNVYMCIYVANETFIEH